jgi:hypothetical protein
LKILEGGFVSISSGRVSFINPSIRDYLTNYLDDTALRALFAEAAQKADWAKAVWNQDNGSQRNQSSRRRL